MHAEQTTTPDDRHVAMLRDVRYQPIFIMGDHRSGTTLLYRLLDATGCFNVVRAYHIIRYGEVLTNHLAGAEQEAKDQLGAYFTAMGVTDRMIDGVQVTPDLPEEYGFLLSGAYRAPLEPDNLPIFDQLCRKVQFTGKPERPLLLKNPWDYFLNFLYVKEAFPRARFIFIHRDPIQVINSQLHAVRTGMHTRNAYLALMSRWYAQLYRRPLQRILAARLFESRLGLRITCKHVVRATDYVMQHIDSLPTADALSLRYEDLCADPDHVVGSILSFLGMDGSTDGKLRALIAPRSLPRAPEMERWQPGLHQRMASFMNRYGYA